jgi:hypothetical protein
VAAKAASTASAWEASMAAAAFEALRWIQFLALGQIAAANKNRQKLDKKTVASPLSFINH